jgi:hypothetical protein
MIQILAVMCLASALQTPVTFVTIARSDQSGIELEGASAGRTAAAPRFLEIDRYRRLSRVPEYRRLQRRDHVDRARR